MWQKILLMNLALEQTSNHMHGHKRDIWKSLHANYEILIGLPLDLTVDESILDRVTKLTKVDCFGMEVNSIPQGLSRLQLDEFYCGQTEIQDLEPLAGQNNLTKVCLYHAPIVNLNGLLGSNLERLCCSGTKVTNLAALRNLPRLTTLSFYDTVVDDMSPLEDLRHLKTVRCHNTALAKKTISEFKDRHPSCTVEEEADESTLQREDF
jgi:Leucine-rich repeat (LRR) protein